MKKSVYMILLALVALPLHAGQTWEKELATAQKKAREGDKLILVEMYADWCGWCKRMARELFPSERFRNATADMVLLQLDTEDRGEGTRMSRELQVNNLPTVFVMTPQMEIAGRIQGYMPPDRWVTALESTLVQFEEFEKRVAEDTGGQTDPQATFDLAVELASRRFFADAEARFWGLVDSDGVPAKLKADSMLELGRMLLYLERNDEATAIFDRIINEGLDDETTALTHLIKAEISFRSHDFQQAMKDLRIVERDFPDTDAVANARSMMRIVQARLGSN